MLGFRSEKSKNFGLKKFAAKDIEPQEIFLDELAKKKEQKWGLTEKKIETPLSKKILLGFYFFSLLLILILGVETFKMQVLQGGDYKILADKNKYIVRSMEATRGAIYDSKGKQLVYNKVKFDLLLNKNKLPKDEIGLNEALKETSAITKKDLQEVENKLEENGENTVLISENLSQETLVLLESQKDKFPFLEVKQNAVRDYPEGEYFCHVLGYMGLVSSQEIKNNPGIYTIDDYVGRAGIEKIYENELRKKGGEIKIQRDAQGNQLSTEVVSLPEPGNGLVLWLDADLQKKVAEEIKIISENVGASAASAVALDPKTGGVLALVNYPSFDNNKRQITAVFKSRYFRIVSNRLNYKAVLGKRGFARKNNFSFKRNKLRRRDRNS
jgi:penicillin-binding protein 2